MNSEVFKNISKIIERDSKSSTYKFALLRGVIDIIQENSPFIEKKDLRVHIPTALLVEKWLMYYYPILESKLIIPQINSTTNLAFENSFRQLIDKYKEIGGFSAFYNDLKNKGIPNELQTNFIQLTKSIKNTIIKMPMKYIGRSISSDYYSIFQLEDRSSKFGVENQIDYLHMINKMGSFSIPLEYFEAFKLLGSFINGQDSILFKWAEFSVNISEDNLALKTVVEKVLKNPITERDIKHSKKIYKEIISQESSINCVWTGEKVKTYDIDHVIPFSIWKNNDLWNLLPAKSKINNLKRDKIPSPELIEKRKDEIIHYWDLINNLYQERFEKEIQIALLGKNTSVDWQKQAISQLQKNCEYLISNRGFTEWNIKKTTNTVI
jgi:hypothetical protein